MTNQKPSRTKASSGRTCSLKDLVLPGTMGHMGTLSVWKSEAKLQWGFFSPRWNDRDKDLRITSDLPLQGLIATVGFMTTDNKELWSHNMSQKTFSVSSPPGKQIAPIGLLFQVYSYLQRCHTICAKAHSTVTLLPVLLKRNFPIFRFVTTKTSRPE